MTATPGPNFAVTPISPHVGTAVRLVASGKPADKAKQFQVCLHCFDAVRGGGLSQDGACTNGCGLTEPEGDAA
ncbi:MAG TPA: hypothetical protein PLJ35_05215 [Anaerolineae bacterium]|nr:hypothetical protein [Anaerolineae bacterium]